MASDDDFFVLRKFGIVGARVALHLQDQVAWLEEQLEHEDKLCRQGPVHLADSGTFRLDQRPNRRQLLADLASSLERYRVCLKFEI